MKKPQHDHDTNEDAFAVEDEFSLEMGDPWRAPEALAKPEEEDPFKDSFAAAEPISHSDHDPFAEMDESLDEPEAQSPEGLLTVAETQITPWSVAEPEFEPEAELELEPRAEVMDLEEVQLEEQAPFQAEYAVDHAMVELEPVDLDSIALDPPAAQIDSAPVAASPAPLEPHAFGHSEHGELSVPRIGIHIFCERPDTAETAARSAKDRRMTRANTLVLPGGLAAAADYYSNQPTPPLIVVESSDHGMALIGHLDRLAEVCDTGTKVVVIGDHNDITLYRELMRRGVSEYLVAPLTTIQLLHAITTLYADPSAPFVGRQIAFCGARGGVGSSTIAHNLAHILSEHMQSSTAIVDFDLPFGTAGLDFNQDPLQGVADALSQPDRLDAVLLDRMMVRCTERLSLFAAPATLDHDYDISAEAFEEVATKMRTTAPFVVLDLPHLWSNWMRRVLLGADEVVITATPDLASLRNAKNIIDLLRQARPNDTPPRLVLNQVGLPGRPEIPIKDFVSALGVETPIIVPFDAKLFGQAANNGQMIGEVNAKAKAAEGLQALAQAIARREPPPAPKKSALSGLFKRK
jgi:pilus assembly protein CpaE